MPNNDINSVSISQHSRLSYDAFSTTLPDDNDFSMDKIEHIFIENTLISGTAPDASSTASLDSCEDTNDITPEATMKALDFMKEEVDAHEGTKMAEAPHKVTDHLFIFDGNDIVGDYFGSLSKHAKCLSHQDNKPQQQTQLKDLRLSIIDINFISDASPYSLCSLTLHIEFLVV